MKSTEEFRTEIEIIREFVEKAKSKKEKISKSVAFSINQDRFRLNWELIKDDFADILKKEMDDTLQVISFIKHIEIDLYNYKYELINLTHYKTDDELLGKQHQKELRSLNQDLVEFEEYIQYVAIAMEYSAESKNTKNRHLIEQIQTCLHENQSFATLCREFLNKYTSMMIEIIIEQLSREYLVYKYYLYKSRTYLAHFLQFNKYQWWELRDVINNTSTKIFNVHKYVNELIKLSNQNDNGEAAKILKKKYLSSNEDTICVIRELFKPIEEKFVKMYTEYTSELLFETDNNLIQDQYKINLADSNFINQISAYFQSQKEVPKQFGNSLQDQIGYIVQIMARISHYPDGSLVPLKDLLDKEVYNVENATNEISIQVTNINTILEYLIKEDCMPIIYYPSLRVFYKENSIAKAIFTMEQSFRDLNDVEKSMKL